MAMHRRMYMQHHEVFPNGVYIVGEVEPVVDFQAGKRADDTYPQKIDKETGHPQWSVPVLDADPEAGKNDRQITVKINSPHQPVPPANPTGLPFVPVEFRGLVVTPWIEYTGGKNKENLDRTRLNYSISALEMLEPGEAKPSKPAAGAAGTSAKAAA